MEVAAHLRVMSRIHVSTNLRNGDPANCFKSDCDLLTSAYVLYYVITSGRGSDSEPIDNHFIYAFLRSSRFLSVVSNYRMIVKCWNNGFLMAWEEIGRILLWIMPAFEWRHWEHPRNSSQLRIWTWTQDLPNMMRNPNDRVHLWK
jgi:hypothetical protein